MDSGDGVTHIVPVYDGYSNPHLIRRLDIAGRDISRQLGKLLLRKGYHLSETADFETIREIKEKLCYVGCDLELERKLALETTTLLKDYILPDGRTIRLGAERFEAPEILFQPHLIDKECPGLAEQLFNAIQAAAVDLRPDLYRHIVLSGGSTMYPGLPTRLEDDLKRLYLERVLQGDSSRGGKVKIRIEDPPKRKHMVFMGGAVLADLMKDNDSFWISKAEWDEHGSRIMETKCPR